MLPVLIYQPRKDERLNWPRWLVIPRWFTQRRVSSFQPRTRIQCSASVFYCSGPAPDWNSSTVWLIDTLNDGKKSNIIRGPYHGALGVAPSPSVRQSVSSQ